MWERHSWIARIEHAWRQRRIVWLLGVRRVGKTTLCRSLDNIEYFDCELPRVRRLFEDPEAFLESMRDRRIVLDEMHRLANPSELLKLAADHFPRVQVLATGSSGLGASARFRDTLTGPKRDVWLTPMTLDDLVAFERSDLPHRLHRGGLPPFFLAEGVPEPDFQEWMDAYWARDIQELFRLERRQSFQRFLELFLSASGGLFEATRFARDCEVSRQTITNYLGVLEATFTAHVVRPYTTRQSTEILVAPKVYGFDTGFVAYYRGWNELRREDYGALWEHFVLNELQANLQTRAIGYWRDKQGHEVDFVLPRRGSAPIAIECVWAARNADLTNLAIFARRYPRAPLYLVARDIERSYTRQLEDTKVAFIGLEALVGRLLSDTSPQVREH